MSSQKVTTLKQFDDVAAQIGALQRRFPALLPAQLRYFIVPRSEKCFEGFSPVLYNHITAAPDAKERARVRRLLEANDTVRGRGRSARQRAAKALTEEFASGKYR